MKFFANFIRHCTDTDFELFRDKQSEKSMTSTTMSATASNVIARALIYLVVVNYYIAHVITQTPPVVLGSVDIVTSQFIADVVLAYQLQEPDVTLIISTDSFDNEAQSIIAESIDFAVVSAALTDAQRVDYPGLQLYPVIAAAIVPVYRLDAISAAAALPLTLTRQLLAQIYLGQVVWWNDTAIASANPTLIMPAVPITVVYYETADPINTVFTSALCKFYAQMCSEVAISVLPVWPTNNYSAFASASSVEGVASIVETIDGAIGYSVLAAALSIGTNVASMVNKANMTVTASSESVNFALVELATQISYDSAQYGESVLDLTDASGASAWPICIPAYLLIDEINTRNTCDIRTATVQFWLFIYQNAIVSKLAASRQYALMPALVLSQLDVINDLVTSVICNNGSPAFTGSVTQQIVLGGAPETSLIMTMLINLYSQSSHAYDYVYTDEGSAAAFEQFADNEIDVALFLDIDLDSDDLALAHPVNTEPLSPYNDAVNSNPNQFITVPFMITSFSPVFNPQITPDVNIGAYNVIIDFNTYVRLFLGNISSWRDPAILQYNPALANVLANETAPIIYISACGNVRWRYILHETILSYQSLLDPPTLNLLRSVPPTLTKACGLSSSSTYDYEIYTESAIDDVVLLKKGSVGYAQLPTVAAQFALIFPLESGQNVTTIASITNQLACGVTAFEAQSLTVNLDGISNSQCWPLSSIVYASFRSSYSSTATDSSSCTRGRLSLSLLQWLVNTTLLAPATYSQYSPRLADVSVIQAATDNAIYSVRCDADLMMISLPEIWLSSKAIVGFGISMAAIGLAALAVATTVVLIYRTHAVMKAASPYFILTSLCGIALLLVGAILLVSDVSPATCSGFMWMINLGFTTTFGPLFAKTWRIYQIFGGKKLNVVKISNSKLAIIVSVMLLIDVILLSIWQGESPMQPIVSTQVSGNPSVTHDYKQCSFNGSGVNFFLAAVVSKCAMLVYGAMLAFSTRRVTSRFNESQVIAWSIYNVVFTIGIITPILLLIDAVGDVLLILLLFLILWISFFTGIILVLPKILSLFTFDDTNPIESVLSSAGHKVKGFSFLNAGLIEAVATLRQYHAALLTQTDIVSHRITALTSGTSAEKEEKTAVLFVASSRNSQAVNSERSDKSKHQRGASLELSHRQREALQRKHHPSLISPQSSILIDNVDKENVSLVERHTLAHDITDNIPRCDEEEEVVSQGA